MKRKFLSKETIDYLFNVDKENGKVYWKHPPRQYRFILIGKEAGTTKRDYCHISIKHKYYKRAHIIYCYATGNWPDPNKEIDHINRITNDDRISNLREVTHQQNIWNRKFNGCFKNYKNKYQVSICVDYKPINLGEYDDEKKAKDVYQNARKQYYGQFAQ